MMSSSPLADLDRMSGRTRLPPRTIKPAVRDAMRSLKYNNGFDSENVPPRVARLIDHATDCVELRASERGLTVPTDRPEIGQQFGDLLKAFCTAEPDSLLYNAVDRAIRRLM